MKNFLMTIVLFLSSAFLGADYVYYSPEMIAKHLKNYTEEEQIALSKDLSIIRDLCLPQQGASKPVYIATAGAPGSRKSTILERFLQKELSYGPIAYIDPDQRTLKFMIHTYYSRFLSSWHIAEYPPEYKQVVKGAYDKWCDGSNYIAYTLLEEAFAQKQNIAHGTTSTKEYIADFFSKVKNAGYEIILLLCSCEDSLRQKAIHYRNEEQKFYQSTPEDALKKGKLFPQKMGTYMTHADTLYLFWSEDLFTRENLAAILKEGELQVLNGNAFQSFVRKYENDKVSLEKEGIKIPSWNELLDLYRSRF